VRNEAQATSLRQRDHLGSTGLITNLDGEIVQHVEYVPFGEVFIEERNNTWNTPYLFNAKELDEETGLYYYGARYFDPRTGIFLGVDPLFELYPGWSVYSYCKNNPVVYIDPTGMTTYKKEEMDPETWRNFDAKKDDIILPKVVIATQRRSFIGRTFDRFKTWANKYRDLPYQEPIYGNSPTGSSAMEPGKAAEEQGPGVDGAPGTGLTSTKAGSIFRKLKVEGPLRRILDKIFPNDDSSSEQRPQTYQVPHAPSAQTPPVSTPNPNEPNVVPPSLKQAAPAPKPNGLQENIYQEHYDIDGNRYIVTPQGDTTERHIFTITFENE
jgi:RHS repeat-associated protein